MRITLKGDCQARPGVGFSPTYTHCAYAVLLASLHCYLAACIAVAVGVPFPVPAVFVGSPLFFLWLACLGLNTLNRLCLFCQVSLLGRQPLRARALFVLVLCHDAFAAGADKGCDLHCYRDCGGFLRGAFARMRLSLPLCHIDSRTDMGRSPRCVPVWQS